MTEEQIFKNLFPEYCVGEKCLSPYFDLFQIGFEEGEKQNEELKEQIADLKNYCCEVSKYLHDNSVARPDASAYKKRDALLIKEFKLCEKWGDLKMTKEERLSKAKEIIELVFGKDVVIYED